MCIYLRLAALHTLGCEKRHTPDGDAQLKPTQGQLRTLSHRVCPAVCTVSVCPWSRRSFCPVLQSDLPCPCSRVLSHMNVLHCLSFSLKPTDQ